MYIHVCRCMYMLSSVYVYVCIWVLYMYVRLTSLSLDIYKHACASGGGKYQFFKKYCLDNLVINEWSLLCTIGNLFSFCKIAILKISMIIIIEKYFELRPYNFTWKKYLTVRDTNFVGHRFILQKMIILIKKEQAMSTVKFLCGWSTALLIKIDWLKPFRYSLLGIFT